MSTAELEASYESRLQAVLVPLAERLERYLKEILESYRRIDRISVRAKSVSSFVAKASKRIRDSPKYKDPFTEIQDQIGARVVTFYTLDVPPVKQLIESYFGAIEARHVAPGSESEFGYEGMHFVLLIPQELLPTDAPEGSAPEFFELQIKTLFQHAWSEADHDLAYKSVRDLTADQKRRVAFTAAQAWGADQVFAELAQTLLT